MKPIFHLITTISRGGAENQLLVLVREQLKLGLEVHIVYLKGVPELEAEFTQMGSMVHHDLVGKHPFFQTFALRKLFEGREIIVHAHLPRAELISLFTLARFTFVASRHNAEPFFPGAPRFISNFFSNLVEIRSHRIIAISEAVKVYLAERGEIRKMNKIAVILYGYSPSLERTSRNLKAIPNIFKIGTISRLTDQKDIPTLLYTFQILHKDAPNSSLSIVGSGPLESNLRELTKKMGLECSVHFLGRTSKIVNFLAELDVFVLSSKYEGFGMVLLEAMDAGIPIVASRNSAIPEVLGLDFPGLCETGNPQDFRVKVQMLKNPAYRKKILALQEIRLRSFDSEVMCRKIISIYSD